MPLEPPSDPVVGDLDPTPVDLDPDPIFTTSTGIAIDQYYVDYHFDGDTGAALQALIDELAGSGGTIWIHHPITVGVSPHSLNTSILRLASDVTIDFLNNYVTLATNSTLFECQNCQRINISNVVVVLFEGIWTDSNGVRRYLGDWIYSCLISETGSVQCNGEAERDCLDPASWTSPTGPCSSSPYECYQTAPIILVKAEVDEETSFNSFTNISTTSIERCDFYNIYCDIVRIDNQGGTILGNVFSRIYAFGLGTGVRIVHHEESGETCLNAFDDCYFYQHDTLIKFDVPDVPTPVAVIANLFHHVKGHTSQRFTDYGVQNISGQGNHFDKTFVWDFSKEDNIPVGCEGRPDWVVLDNASDTYIAADFIYSLCDAGRDTFVLTTPVFCNLPDACACVCVIDDEVGQREGHWQCQ